MVWAQWGQKEKLVNNPDVWLCHQCSDCTAKCPRDARPGEVLGAVRRTAYKHFAWPGFMGGLFSDTKFLPVVFGVPVLLLLAVIGAIGSFSPEGQIVFAKFIGEIHIPFWPHEIPGVDLLFVPFAALAVFSAFVSLNEFWKGMEAQVDSSVPRKGFGQSAKELLGELITHATFKKCVSSAGRSTAHQLVLFGFVGLFITTNFVFVYEYLLHIKTPLLLFSVSGFVPKVLGNVSGVALIVGSILMVQNRMANSDDNPASGYDWLFLGVIFLVGLTGFLAQFTRMADMAGPAYLIYFLHLVFVFYIIAYLPFSKLAHLLYRSLAIIHAKNVGRDALAIAAPTTAAAVPEVAEAAEPAAEAGEAAEEKKEAPEASA